MFAIKSKIGWSGKRKREWMARRGLQLLPEHFPMNLRILLRECLDVPENRPDVNKILEEINKEQSASDPLIRFITPFKLLDSWISKSEPVSDYNELSSYQAGNKTLIKYYYLTTEILGKAVFQ